MVVYNYHSNKENKIEIFYHYILKLFERKLNIPILKDAFSQSIQS